MDPTTLETAHIHNLHDDILLHIFNINILTPEAEHSGISSTYRRRKYYPLNTTRNASQVCRYWRRLILEYPSIWGCLIDLDVIRSDAWAEEVMARAGSAYLSVYGQIGRTQQSTSFFTNLVVNHWDRICKIHVSVAWDFPLDQSVWNVIQDRPAPNLESFVCDVSFLQRLESASCNGPLFANSAPSLRRFHDCGSRFFNLGPNSAWLYQLSSVTLSTSLSTTDVLNILSNSVQLESLTLHSIVFNHSARSWTKHIHLPRLAHINIQPDTSFEEVLLYLKYIVPKYGCGLSLFSHVDEEELEGPLDDVYLPSFAKSIASYSTPYFNLHKPTKFYIQDDSSSFSLRSEKDTEMVYFGHPKLDLFMHCFGLPTPPVSFDQLYGAVASTSLQCITQLTLRILGQDIDSWISTEKPGFVDFICSFPSVESLVIPDETLLILNHILPDCPQAFPSLRQVELLISALAEAVSQFLSDRKAAEAPITFLVIDNFPQLRVRGDWRFLDEYDNMYLLWDDHGAQIEYKCGSGEM